ncbi:MAG: short-chain dehydrogenase [Betaproteobacteria bacterium SG8_40]|nr:MAG: short-chain dehydrogenase [Betaproteobacteria bacterium SG8_40]
MEPVCLVIGAGAGIGGNVARRFALEGYHAVLCRRSNEQGLNKMVQAIRGEGGKASGFILNAVEENSIEDRIAAIEADIGPIEVFVFNLGAQTGNLGLEATSSKAFELGWRLATFSLFRAASVLCPRMEKRGKGTFLVTSSTAAMRGNPGQHSHAAAMGAPDTLGKLLGPERFQDLREKRGLEHDGLLLPERVADTYYHLSQQHRSAWTHEIDLRPFSEKPWWNS